jgi:hypothetical protein
MPTLFDPATREALLARVDRLTPDSRPLWGRMSVSEMVTHLNQSLMMATGELVCAPKGGPLSFPPLRWLVIHLIPFPRGAPTAPELLAGQPATALEEDRARFRELIDQVVAKGPEAQYPAHPVFGRFHGRDWGVLTHKHIDHHLRQFQV